MSRADRSSSEGKKLKVLVSGAGGFLGSRVVTGLLQRGHEVRAIIRSAAARIPAESLNRAEIVRADLRTAPALEELFGGVDVLVHLAATVSGTMESQFEGSVAVTERLLEGMRRAGSARHIVLASSFSVYDFTQATTNLTEDSPLESRPDERDGYAVAKLCQERVANRLAGENGWTLAILRPGPIYGPGAAPVASAGLKLGRAFVVVAPCARLRLTHVENCAAAFVDAVEKKAAGTFNIVDDERVSAWTYAGRLLGGSRVWRLPFPYGAGLALAHAARITSRILLSPGNGKLPGILIPRQYCARFRPLRCDNRRAKEVLGWHCKEFFRTGCDVT